MCGACLNINVGSVNEKIDGLAHFLEHMVFMGSNKYPDSNDFMANINKNGGKTNAYTSDTDTNYHFTSSSESFLVNLDKFAQFFLDPLLKEEYVNLFRQGYIEQNKQIQLTYESYVQILLFRSRERSRLRLL